MKKISIFIVLFLMLVCFFNISVLAKTKNQAEIYITSKDAPDPKNEDYIVSEGIYEQTYNLVGVGFEKTQEVNIFLNDDFLGSKVVEGDSFVGDLSIVNQLEEKTFTIKAEGEARGEDAETQIVMKTPGAIPTWVWVVGTLVLIGIGIYYIYRLMFQE